MEKFVRLTAVAAPLHEPNIDTDQLIPARFLGKPRRAGFADFLLRDRRFAEDGSEITRFVLNKAAYREARILLAGGNFGCGSSRESAVYALADYGFRVGIAPSFGDIFASNARKNGLLLIRLPDAYCDRLRRDVALSQHAPVEVDLEAQKITLASGQAIAFAIDADDRRILMEGLDDIGRTLRQEAAIARFEAET